MKHGKLCLIMFFIVCLSCQNQMDLDKLAEVEEATDPEVLIDEEDGEPLTSLEGTKWKLAGIVDVQSGDMKKIDPTHCDECYTLVFDTDSTFTAISIGQRTKIDLRQMNPITDDLLRCERYSKDGKDYCDSDDFNRSIRIIESCSVTNKELRLVCKGGYKYLSFIPHEGDNPSSSRIGTQWKLEGIVDVETGKINELNPKDCAECYTLTFWGDYNILTQSIWALQILDLLNLDLVHDPSRPWGYEVDRQPLGAEEWCKDSHNPEWDGECMPYEDSYLFRCGIAFTEAYEFSPDGLKLFFIYQEKNYYLFFKLIYS